MVFLGVDYWTNRLPVLAVLQALFSPADFARCVRVTDDPMEAARFVIGFE
jgi:hypothetical protein